MPARWSHASGLGTIGSCLEHAAVSTHIWRPARAAPVLIWREGGRARVPRRSRPGERAQAGSSPSLHHQSPPTPPATFPSSSLAPPPSLRPLPSLVRLVLRGSY